MNSQLIQNQSTLQPKKGSQRNQYVGPLHISTKKRHGKGNYQYKNKFFQYEGEYVQGKKHGLGSLKMNDGTIIEATFVEDQIQGEGKITYPDGSTYIGQLQYGQKCGKGVFESSFQRYDGEWKQNSRQGQGRLEILSTGQVFEGTFNNNKLQGQGSLKSYNYQYIGEWSNGKKQGYGQQINLWRRIQQQVSPKEDISLYEKSKNYDSYEYQGNFSRDSFHGQGKYTSKTSGYVYEGEFIEGLPKDYPNEFRIFVSSSSKNQNGEEKESDKILLEENTVLQYQLEGEAKNIYVQCVYQGPEYLDEIQPTEEEIQNMIKNWQNENKKNKNPPPMPDFKTPKMKKPELILITQQTNRQIHFTLEKQGNQGKQNRMKIDYRNQILQKRSQIQKMKEQLKKTEEEDPKKKGSKKQAKTQTQFKINLYKQTPTQKEKILKIETTESSCCLKQFELPDDFPQGKHFLIINSPFQDFGKLKPRKIQLLIKTKQAATKKK